MIILEISGLVMLVIYVSVIGMTFLSSVSVIEALCADKNLSPKQTARAIISFYLIFFTIVGCIIGISTTIGILTAILLYLVVCGTPFYLIIRFILENKKGGEIYE